jgi:hypothetical protein
MASKKAANQVPPFERVEVAEVYAAVPTTARDKLMQLRTLIFETAREMPEVGPIEEALRWGEPSYLTPHSKSGTTIRIHWKQRNPEYCALYVNCQTTLIEEYRLRHPQSFEFEGNRAVLFRVSKPLPKAALRDCVRLALTYHIR